MTSAKQAGIHHHIDVSITSIRIWHGIIDVRLTATPGLVVVVLIILLSTVALGDFSGSSATPWPVGGGPAAEIIQRWRAAKCEAPSPSRG